MSSQPPGPPTGVTVPPAPAVPTGPGGVAGVAAVVVTHRRPRLATQVVEGLVSVEGLAPSQVFVVVNGAGGLADAELERSVSMLRLAENLGPAAGFRAGMLAALASGPYRWCYCCEDDVSLFDLPSPRLAGLVARVESFETSPGVRPVGAAVAYGRDLRPWTGHTVVHRGASDGLEPIDVACWGASLVSRRVLEAGVLPSDEWFFGFEDFDFFLRIRRAGLLVLEDRAAASAVAAQMTLSGRDAALATERPVDDEEPWRAYYTSRNYFRYARTHGRLSWIGAHLAYSARRYQLARSPAERRALLAGLADGLRGCSGPHPAYQRAIGERAEPDPGRASGGIRGRLVLHVLPNDVARGAQVVARDVCRALDRQGERHELLTIFAAPPVLLGAEHRLEARSGWWRARGFDPVTAWRLRRLLADLRPDALVAHGGEPLKYLALARPAGTPLVYLAFGIVTDAARRGWRRRLYRWLYHRADVVAGVSGACVTEARERFGVPPARLVLLPNARDPDQYRPGPRAPEGRAVRLLFVGHLTATKRPERFVALVSALRARGLDVEGVMVGDGPMEAVLRTGAPDGVTLLGRRDDVAAQLAAGDVLVFPSVPESEGMPGVLIEAGLAGLPVVATDCPGVRDVVADGETGFVVGVEEEAAMEEAAGRLVGDARLRAEMGAAARARCVERFSLGSSTERWQALIDRVTEGAALAGPGGTVGLAERTATRGVGLGAVRQGLVSVASWVSAPDPAVLRRVGTTGRARRRRSGRRDGPREPPGRAGCRAGG